MTGRVLKIGAVLALLAAVVVLVVVQSRRAPLPQGFVSAVGRIEATEVDVATRLPGRLAVVLVKEGDMVSKGQLLARMDTGELVADLRGAQARLQQAVQNRKYAEAIVTERQSDLDYVAKQLRRTRDLVRRRLASREKLDRDRSRHRKALAALQAARFRVAESAAAIDATRARIDKLRTLIRDSSLRAPVDGRVLYRLAEPGEVLAAGGRVLTLLKLTDVYMTVFLPTRVAGRLSLNAQARIIIDARPDLRIPARVSFVAPRAQFTPKEVETKSERDKLMFRVKLSISPDLLKKHIDKVKTGVTGTSYIRLDPKAKWPEFLQVKLPE